MAGKSKFIALITLAAVALGVFVYRDLIFRPKPAYLTHSGKPITDAMITDAAGKRAPLSSIIRPQSKVILSLWATWCEPCTHELPLIQRMIPELEKSGVQVILMNYDGPLPDKALPEVKAWLVSQKLDMTTYFDFGEELLKTLNIEGLPFTIGLNDDGKTVNWMQLGELEWSAKEKILAYFNK